MVNPVVAQSKARTKRAGAILVGGIFVLLAVAVAPPASGGSPPPCNATTIGDAGVVPLEHFTHPGDTRYYRIFMKAGEAFSLVNLYEIPVGINVWFSFGSQCGSGTGGGGGVLHAQVASDGLYYLTVRAAESGGNAGWAWVVTPT